MNTPKHVSEPVASHATASGPAASPLPASANADIQGSWAAMRRAAQRARQVAQQTGTDLIVVRAGQVVRVPPQPKAQP
jgi:hypothetical protein